MPSVVQTWVSNLTLMQQSVLFTALRGPDGIHKNHVSKQLARWLRRCVLMSAFDKRVLLYPYDTGKCEGGSFTGASIAHFEDADEGNEVWQALGHDYRFTWQDAMFDVLEDYLKTTDETPHHFQLHFLHAAEIIGYKHPELAIRHWWSRCYERLVNDMHLVAESERMMDRRLGDNEQDWRMAEEVTADP